MVSTAENTELMFAGCLSVICNIHLVFDDELFLLICSRLCVVFCCVYVQCSNAISHWSSFVTNGCELLYLSVEFSCF